MSTTPNLDDGFLTPDEVQEVRQTFFDQARAALEALAPQILALEGRVPTPDRLRSLRRAAHTLKGDCASVGFGDLSRLAHALEDAFGTLEKRNRPVSPTQTDVLLSAVDHLAAGLEAGAASRSGPDPEPLIARLLALGEVDGRARADGGIALSAPQVAALEEGGSRGEHVLRVSVKFSARRRGRAAALDRLIEGAGLRVIAREPQRPARHVELVGLSPHDAATVQARVVRPAGLDFRVQPWRARPALDLPDVLGEPTREGENVRIESRRVDEVLNLIGEMVTARSTIAGVTTEIQPFLSEEMAARLSDAQSLLERVLQDLQRSAMRMRMVPVGRVFRRFSRVVRDLGRQTGKRLVLRVEGEATELDRAVLDALEEPLLHLVRNGVDHGLEGPDERRARGKAEEGHVTLRASREGNQVLIEVSDDGKGIDAVAVARTAVEKGLISAAGAASLSQEESLQLVFRPGLSTATVITETSGRGVGLDIVRQKVEALKGSIRASNAPEGGACFVIRVPLTVAIIQALLFRAGGQHLAVPLTSVVEIARAGALSVRRLGGHQVFRLREAALGLVRLGALLDRADPGPDDGFVIVLQSSVGRFGILVDELVGEQELVIKAVHDRWIRTSLVAGASVLGGGTLALILDVLAVHRAALGRGVSAHA